MGTNVQIPLSLFMQTLDFFFELDAYELEQRVRTLYDDVYSAFIKKHMKINLRNSYAKIINAENENERKQAIGNYLIDRSFSK